MTSVQPFDHAEMEHQYELQHLRPDQNFISRWAERSAAVRASAPCKLDIPYGSDAREQLDFFPAPNNGDGPTLIFVHGGYWQKGDKSVYSFVAEPFTANGVSVITLSYSLCPTVRLTQISPQIRKALAWLWNNGKELGISPDKLHIMGHSAGAHLTAMMMTTDWQTIQPGIPTDFLKSAIPISGIYDLQPLLFTHQKDALRLSEDEAVAESPTNHILRMNSPQLVACGQDESAEFNRQSDVYVERFNASSRHMRRYSVSGRNHFEVLDELTTPGSDFFQQALSLIKAQHSS